MLTAIPFQRGWEHSRHRHCHQPANRLRVETGDGDIWRFFNSASELHENFYENEMDVAIVAENLDDVEVLLDKLRPLLAQT